MSKPTLRVLNPNPVQQASAFQPPPTGRVTIDTMERQTIAYWKTVRVAWLAGYQISWVIPGRDGAVTGSRSVWNLDARVRPVEAIHPSRTARYSLQPYVLVGGRPYVEPMLGTRLTIRATVTTTISRGVGNHATEAPAGLGETARWLPTPESYVNGVWAAQVPNVGPDAGILWRASEANLPFLNNEYMYSKRWEWITATSLSIQGSNFLRLEGMPISPAQQPITLFFVAGMTAPVKYWGSLIRAVEPDGSSQIGVTLLDLRLMADGNLHPFTWGWQRPLPLVGDSHAMSLFGFTLDAANNFVRFFTIDRTLRMSEMGLPFPHSTTANFVLGRPAEALFNIDLLDVLMFRGPMDADQTEQIANELDAAYGITTANSQEQG